MRVIGYQRGRRVIEEWPEQEFHAWCDKVWMRVGDLWDGTLKKKGNALALFQQAMSESVMELMEGPCGACGSRRMKNVGREIKCTGCDGVRV